MHVLHAMMGGNGWTELVTTRALYKIAKGECHMYSLLYCHYRKRIITY